MKSKSYHDHYNPTVGNRRFRITVALFLKQYQARPARNDRSALIISIVDMIHQNGGRFLKEENNCWVALTKQQACSKVGHALRDAASKSSSKRLEKENCGVNSCQAGVETVYRPIMNFEQKDQPRQKLPAIQSFELGDNLICGGISENQNDNRTEAQPEFLFEESSADDYISNQDFIDFVSKVDWSLCDVEVN